jgi:signal peptidase I
MNFSSSISSKERSAMFKKIYIFVIGFLLATVAYLQPYRLVVVVGDSMFPTYKSGQILLATRATEIKKDDVVVVKNYDFETIIKRIKYEPSEKYYYLLNKTYIIPFLIIDNSYSNISKYYNFFEKKKILELKVPLNHYYILGDNFENSEEPAFLVHTVSNLSFSNYIS